MILHDLVGKPRQCCWQGEDVKEVVGTNGKRGMEGVPRQGGALSYRLVNDDVALGVQVLQPSKLYLWG